MSFPGAVGLGGGGDSANCHLKHPPRELYCSLQHHPGEELVGQDVGTADAADRPGGSYQGSARNFRRSVAEQKVLWRNANRYQRRPAVWSPGDYLVMDWAQAAPGLMVSCAVLAYSGWRFVRFAADEKTSTTLAMIGQALEAIGGVPANILADRMGCLKGGVVANVGSPHRITYGSPPTTGST